MNAQVFSINQEKENRSQRGVIAKLEADCNILVEHRKMLDKMIMRQLNIGAINNTHLADARANVVEAYGENKTLINIYKAEKN